MAIEPVKFDEYIRHCIDYNKSTGRLRSRATITELVAVGAAESGLDNMAVGENWKNGTPVTSEFYYSIGFGWLQHDSGWLEKDRDLNGVDWTLEDIRRDPKYSIDLLYRRPGMILFEGLNRTYINFKLWNVWPKKSDEFLDEADAAFDRYLNSIKL